MLEGIVEVFLGQKSSTKDSEIEISPKSRTDLTGSNKLNTNPELNLGIFYRKQIDSGGLGYTQNENFLLFCCYAGHERKCIVMVN